MHSMHHDHHSSSTHNSPICFWVCTAGQMEESTAILPTQITQFIDIIDPQLFSLHPTAAFSYQYARGPPPSFLTIRLQQQCRTFLNSRLNSFRSSKGHRGLECCISARLPIKGCGRGENVDLCKKQGVSQNEYALFDYRFCHCGWMPHDCGFRPTNHGLMRVGKLFHGHRVASGHSTKRNRDDEHHVQQHQSGGSP